MARTTNEDPTLVIAIPTPCVDEMEALCEQNAMGKTEFLYFALTLLTDYMDQYSSLEAIMKRQNAAKKKRQARVRAKAAKAAKGISAQPDSLEPEIGQSETLPLLAAPQDFVSMQEDEPVLMAAEAGNEEES